MKWGTLSRRRVSDKTIIKVKRKKIIEKQMVSAKLTDIGESGWLCDVTRHQNKKTKNIKYKKEKQK